MEKENSDAGQSVLDVHPGSAGTGLGDGERVVAESPALFTFYFSSFFFLACFAKVNLCCLHLSCLRIFTHQLLKA
jgi:hypothetical protein